MFQSVSFKKEYHISHRDWTSFYCSKFNVTVTVFSCSLKGSKSRAEAVLKGFTVLEICTVLHFYPVIFNIFIPEPNQSFTISHVSPMRWERLVQNIQVF